jgi:hypothetical protein
MVLHFEQRIYWLIPGWYWTLTKQFPHLKSFKFGCLGIFSSAIGLGVGFWILGYSRFLSTFWGIHLQIVLQAKQINLVEFLGISWHVWHDPQIALLYKLINYIYSITSFLIYG